MTTQPISRRHHLVSKFYLRYFADDVGVLTAVELPGDRRFPLSIGNATVQRDYYLAIGINGELTDQAESAFAEIETAAAEAWVLACDGAWPLPDPQREAVGAWIALQLLRGPSVRASMGEIGSSMVQLQIAAGGRERLRAALRDIEEPHDDESVDREWVALFTDKLVMEVHANHHIQHIISALPRATESILRRWWVLTRYERKRLATSDHPVAVVPNARNVALGRGTGIENADEISLPFTRSAHLSLALRDALPSELAQLRDFTQVGSSKTALYGNDVTAKNARRYLFHHPGDAPLAGLELPQPRSQELISNANPWNFMSDEDRQVLIGAGLTPP